jgi:4-hydroxy-tetrahydrodipicolinate synthase
MKHESSRMHPGKLQGVWAALPTPWTENFGVSARNLEENIRRYEARGVDGVYTSDSDGEFYALELEQFRELVTVFARTMRQTRMGAAVGVTWSHTQGIIDRIRNALDAGVPNVHVAFPYWMPLARTDVPRFFDDLAEGAPAARWIHYRTSRAHILLSGSEYALYQRTYPEQFIGTKLVTTDIAEIAAIVSQAPELSHFVTDYCSVSAKLAGARGVYSYWVNTMPDWTLRTWHLCEEGCWEEAMRRQCKLILWERGFIQKLRQMGHNHGVIGKARAALTGFLIDSGLTRPPYYPIDANFIEDLKREFLNFWADDLNFLDPKQM